MTNIEIPATARAKPLLVGILTVTAVLIGTATSASADVITYSLTSDFCTGTCGLRRMGPSRQPTSARARFKST